MTSQESEDFIPLNLTNKSTPEDKIQDAVMSLISKGLEGRRQSEIYVEQIEALKKAEVARDEEMKLLRQIVESLQKKIEKLGQYAKEDREDIELLRENVKKNQKDIELLWEDVEEDHYNLTVLRHEKSRKRTQRDFECLISPDQKKLRLSNTYEEKYKDRGEFRGFPIWKIIEEFPYLDHLSFEMMSAGYKTVICRKNEQGHCPLQKWNCNFAHNKKESTFFRRLAEQRSIPRYHK